MASRTSGGTGRPRPRTSELLCHLLTHEPAYRDRWLRHAERAGRSELNRAAVARVLAHHLWDTGERDDTEPESHRRMRDTVSRALSGGVISARTLQWLIEAFVIDDDHAGQLWSRYAADGPGPSPEAPEVDEVQRVPMLSTAYRTISLDERHFVGHDRIPVKHETVQVIEALEPLQRYTLVYDQAQTRLEVFRGGAPSTPYRPSVSAPPGFYAVDIHLPAPIQQGETAVLGYRNVFLHTTVPTPEFRRLITRPVRSVVLQVHFDADQLPAQLWHARWSSVEGEPDLREPVSVGRDYSVHRYLADVEPSMVGFCWSWD